jgi:selenocysteine lyase/cysteine desulfurase
MLGAAGALALVAGCESAPPPAPPAFDPKSWASVRDQFDLTDGVANFAAFVFASHPRSVRDAVAAHRKGLDLDPTGYLNANETRLDEAVSGAAATYLETAAGQLAFTDSTTMGLGLLYSGLRLGPGDEILTTEHDFYATHESLRLRTARDGATVRTVRLYEDPAKAGVDEIVGNLRAAVTGATRIVAVTWVHSGTGVRLPIRAMADALRGRDLVLCVDGVHGFAAVDETPDRLGADFLVAGCHKWLSGPRGTGLIWGRQEAWPRFTPVIPTFGPAGGAAGVAATPGGYHSFEHRWALAEAFGFHAAIGRARVAARIRDLATALKDGLAGVPAVKIHTPRSADLSAGIVCCEVGGTAPGDAVAQLRQKKVVASVTPYARQYLRFGTSVVTDEHDVEAAVKAVRALV